MVDEELVALSHMDMTFKRELNLLGRTFLFPQKGIRHTKLTLNSYAANYYDYYYFSAIHDWAERL